MSKEQKVVLITGASKGIGAALVAGFRARGFGVVANSRAIEPSAERDVLTVAGDIARPETAAYVTGEILHVDGGAHAGRW
ncbi:MAG TPA: SDR family NAD(P)-dependent oxidoreductase [Stellaceae bacterium]|nr:SDR family NAD(P)-dependent oxidoreductase [Stellaceae bacterium]